MKIRDANMNLILQNKFGVPLLQARDYLFNILGPNKRLQLEQEIDDFMDNMKEIYQTSQNNTVR